MWGKNLIKLLFHRTFTGKHRLKLIELIKHEFKNIFQENNRGIDG